MAQPRESIQVNHPTEIAYWKGNARGINGPNLPGSSLSGMGANTYAWAKARSRFVSKDDLYLWLTSGESGLVIAKFTDEKTIKDLHLKHSPGNEEPND
jgi:hypothetical protein